MDCVEEVVQAIVGIVYWLALLRQAWKMFLVRGVCVPELKIGRDSTPSIFASQRQILSLQYFITSSVRRLLRVLYSAINRPPNVDK